MSNDTLPTIAIVGRPNVGKSSLFNAVLGRRIAIVHEQSGVTRDRVSAPAHRKNKHFLLVDTGGVGVFRDDRHVETFDGLIRDQVARVVAEADHVIWVVDSQDGVTPLDRELGLFLRESGRPVTLAANKADNVKLADSAAADFATLGAGQPMPITCTHGHGVEDLLETVLAALPATVGDGVENVEGLKLAVVGRPNVGKSSLVNTLIGENRVIVSDIAGTTRDAIDIPIEIVDETGERVPFTLIDTAGIRRRRQVDNVVELFSSMRAENAVKRCDVAILVIDAQTPATSQDRRIARLIADARKPCILVANKWDLACETIKLKDLKSDLDHDMKFMSYATTVGISAKSGYNVDQVVEALMTIRDQMGMKIPTSIVNQFLQDVIARTPPPAGPGGKTMKLLYATMTDGACPHTVMFVNQKGLCPASYQSFLENRLRDAFFSEGGMPVWIELRSRRSTGDQRSGARTAAAGAQSVKTAARKSRARHNERRKGYRKK
ncbi:MAG: ribosome biogenesis GTPase Der [Lentisphaeria bacterium]|nr:ribosome biogenesis GTPase Der [Lentisphaeria bacterium]